MTVQERFTPEEWQEVVAGPLDAGMMIIFTHPQGPIGLVHEMKAIYEATITGVINSPSELIREVGAVLAKQQGQGGEADQLKASTDRAKAHSQGDPQAYFLGQVTRAATLVSQKAPADAPAYKQWLGECAEKTAQAAKEGGLFGFGGTQVTTRETAAIDKLRSALDGLAADPALASTSTEPAAQSEGTGSASG